jgi:hypothetical protein
VIVSANLNRLNRTVSQRAMGLAMMYPAAERGRGKKDAAVKDAAAAGITARRLQEARTILRVVPETAKLVLAGTKSVSTKE